MATDKHEQIRRRAYEIWENEGRSEGAAQRHWLQASDELEEDNEHETLQDLIDEDDRDDEALLHATGESGNFGRQPPAVRSTSEGLSPDTESSRREMPPGRKNKKTPDR